MGCKSQICLCLALCLLATGCSRPVNAPRDWADYGTNTLFSSFSGRSPKTLDPQASYSSDETLYTYTIYEPPYSYHYLKRPYEIVPRTAQSVAFAQYLGKDGQELSSSAPDSQVAFSRYRILLKQGIYFAPHPCFVRDKNGDLLYTHLSEQEASHLRSPLDLPQRATRELTAEDYVYGIKRIADPRTVSPILGVMKAYLPGLETLSRQIAAKMQEARKEGRAFSFDLRSASLDGVRALDKYTLEITIRGKYPQFSNWLTMSFFAPVPWEAVAFYANPGFAKTNISLATWPVGTGPFYLASSKENREHVLERNPNYRVDLYPCEGEPGDEQKGYLADCGKPLPFLDRIVMTMEKEAVPAGTKFLQGYYDSPQVTRLDVGPSYLVAAQDSEDKARLYKEKELQFPTSIEANLWYIGFNWLDPVVGAGKNKEEAERHRKLRQAISIAIDWEEQIAIFEKGQGKAAAGPLPPGLFGWRDNGPSAFNSVVYRRQADGRIVRRSLTEAKELLAQAGYPDGRDAKTGKPLVLNFDWQGAAPQSKSFLEWFSRQFAKLGIQLEIRATDYNRFQDKMMKGAAQIYYWGWLADYPDAENFLFLLYGPNSKVGSSSGGENASNYRNGEYDRLFERMKFMENGPEKQKVIDRMIEIVQNDAPWSFGYYPTSAAALQHWVKNAKPTEMVRNNVQYLRVDAAERISKITVWNRPVWWPLLLLGVLAGGFVWMVARIIKNKSRANAYDCADRRASVRRLP